MSQNMMVEFPKIWAPPYIVETDVHVDLNVYFNITIDQY